MVSCLKTEEMADSLNGEICINPVVPDMTKTRAGGVGEYPEGGSFGVFAYHSDAEGGEKWSDAGAAYFENHKFKNQDGICAGVDPVYWPLEGSLIFAGYSPYEETDMAHFVVITKTLTINDYTVDGKKDLMYFLPELSEGKYVGYDKSSAPIPVNFHHALSYVSINVAAKSGDEANIKLKSITLKDVYTQGDFSVIASAPTSGAWDGLTAKNDIVLHSSDTDAGTDLSSALDLEYFTIPGSASVIEIVYLDRGVEKSHSITPDHIDFWNQGLKYQYNITLSVGLDPIVIDPSVEILPKYEGGMLTGSVVEVDLGLSQEELDRIKDLNIFVKDSEDIVYKSYSDADNVANAISFDSGEKLYVPSQNEQKEYYVNFSYHDGLSYRTVTKIVTPDKPEFCCHISYVTLLNELRIHKAYVTISDDVLNEVNMTYTLTAYREGGGSYVVNEQNVVYNRSCFMEDSSISLSLSGKYRFGQAFVKFDEVDSSTMFNGQATRTFTVPLSYSIGERVELASNLEPNVKYALSLNKDSNNQSRHYWSNNGNLAYQSFYSNTTNDLVFLYERDDSQKHTKANEYNFSSAGAWISASNFKYLDANWGFSTTPTYFTCASVWGDESYDANKLIVDIYCNSKSAFINRYDGGYSWIITGDNTSYKWNVYKVIDNY